MKKIIALSLLCCMLVTTFVYSSNEMAASPVPSMSPVPQKSKKARTYYYVVLGSYSSLKHAIKAANETPFDVFYGIYEVTVKGKKYYRVALPCASKADAQRFIRDLIDYYYDDFGAWIWSTQTKPKQIHY